MNKIEIALRSKAFWSLVGVFALSGLEAIMPSLNGNALHIAQAILALVSFYQHPTELKKVGQTGMLAGRAI